MTQRVELHLHTTVSGATSVITPKEAICAAAGKGLEAIAITDRDSVQAFHEIQYYRQRYGGDLKVIYGAELSWYEGGEATVLAKDREGLKVLYRLISGEEITPEEREHLLVGAINFSSFKLTMEQTPEKQQKQAAKYDYIQLFRCQDREIDRQWNRELYALGKKLGIPVVAASDCRCVDPEEFICVQAVETCREPTTAAEGAYLQTAEEMLEHYAYLGKEAAREVVLTNPKKIADSIRQLDPFAGVYPDFALPGAFETVLGLCEERLEQRYGAQPPKEIRQRLETELSLLGENASMCLLSHKIAKQLHDRKAITGTRGTVGSTLMTYLLEISDINPLPPHYRCAVCKHTEFAEADSGYDLPEKTCPHCGAPMAGDGHNIPYETCMGPEGDMQVDIDINVPVALRGKAVEYLAQLLGMDRVAYAGTVSCFQRRLAESYAHVYSHISGKHFSQERIQWITDKLSPVKKGEGRHPGGVVLLPEGMQWEDVTPVQHLDVAEHGIDKVTHMEYYSVEAMLRKLDLLGHGLMDRLQTLFAVTGAKPEEINYSDTRVYQLFEEGDLCGVPEFSHPFCRGILKRLEKIRFSDLVRVSGMSHGTEVWLGNGAYLLQDHPFRELIGDRDDIFLTLHRCGIDRKTAYKVMTTVRKGRFCDKNQRNDRLVAMLEQAGVPDWYIGSMKKIRYLFPKAHAACYTKLAVTAAWFKVYHPEEFYNVTLEDLGAEAFLDERDEQLKQRLELLEEADHTKDRERDAILLLLEARQRRIPIRLPIFE